MSGFTPPPTATQAELSAAFVLEWEQARHQVLAFCRYAVENQHDVDDIVQQVAVRAWLGYARFNREAAFSTWVLSIARREIARFMGRRQTAHRSEQSLEALLEQFPDKVVTSDPGQSALSNYGWITEMLPQALAAGELKPVEAAVIRARLAAADVSWDEVGTAIGLPGPTCAVLHCRALPKLRVFLFLRQPQLLADRDAMEVAFRQALLDSSEPLTSDEAEVFRRCVFEHDDRYRKAGWRTALRAACHKVIKHLDLP